MTPGHIKNIQFLLSKVYTKNGAMVVFF